MTALIIAKVKGHDEVVRRLLDHGGDVARTHPTDQGIVCDGMPESQARSMGHMLGFLNERSR